MDYTEIKFDVREDGIATMTLHRPERLNSFQPKMFDEWKDVDRPLRIRRKISGSWWSPAKAGRFHPVSI